MYLKHSLNYFKSVLGAANIDLASAGCLQLYFGEWLDEITKNVLICQDRHYAALIAPSLQSKSQNTCIDIIILKITIM